ncbi:MAG: mannosyltransferase family protein [Chloroflexia bacterium]
MGVRSALFTFIVSRVIALAGAWVGIGQLVASEPVRNKGLLVEGAMMWDGSWYWQVVSHGYYAWTPQTGSDLAFCPAYPLLLRGLTGLLDLLRLYIGVPGFGNFALVGLLVSNLAFFAALLLLWRLVRLDHPAPIADRTLLLIAIFPTGLFWSAIYTESLFLLMVVGVFWLARQERWALAAVLAGLAGVTRWVGVLLGLVLLVEYFTTQPRGHVLRYWWLLLVPLPLLAYMAYLQAAFGNPLAFLQAEQQGWLHTSSFPPQVWLDSLGRLLASWGTTTPATDPVFMLGGGQRLYMYQDLAFTVLFAGIAVFAGVKRLLRPSELTWLVLGLLFPLSLGTTIGAARYLLPLWPAFLVGARLLTPRRPLEAGWLLASSALLAATAYFWASGHWMD